MHARSTSLGNPLPCLMLPLFALFCTSENYVNFCNASDLQHGHSERSSAKRGGHQPVDNGHRPILSLLTCQPIDTLDSRSAISSCKLLLLLQQSTNRGMTIHLQENVCTTTLLIMFEAQRSVVLDSRAINHAFRCMMAKEAELQKSIWMKCTKTHKCLNLYYA